MNALFLTINKEKRQRIIQESLTEFGHNGYMKASTNRIVKAVGISKGSLFKYFDTKKDLFLYLVEYANKCLLESIKIDGCPDMTWRDRLYYYASVEFDFYEQYPLMIKFYRQMLQDFELDLFQKEYAELLFKSNELFVSMLEEEALGEQFIQHISFVVKGYNDWFNKMYFSDLSKKVDSKLKAIYLKGLETHLLMIGGYNENEDHANKWI